MNEYKTHFDTPEDAYFGFFEADASQNGDAWSVAVASSIPGGVYRMRDHQDPLEFGVWPSPTSETRRAS